MKKNNGIENDEKANNFSNRFETIKTLEDLLKLMSDIYKALKEKKISIEEAKPYSNAISRINREIRKEVLNSNAEQNSLEYFLKRIEAVNNLNECRALSLACEMVLGEASINEMNKVRVALNKKLESIKTKVNN